MPSKSYLNIEIDKLTRSIENSISGDSFKTQVLNVTAKDIKVLNKKDWLFNWDSEFKDTRKVVYKLVIVDNPTIIQGLISLEDKGDHVFMHLIESNRFNRSSKKLYLGVPGNLVAFACKLSFEKGYEGFISFEAKTKLIAHYEQTLGAYILFGNIMALNSKAAANLITNYFPDNN
jgi:hypothetical protein